MAGSFAKFVNNSAYPVVLIQLNNVGGTAPLTGTFEQGFEPTFFIPANSDYEYTLPVVDGPTNGGDDSWGGLWAMTQKGVFRIIPVLLEL